ncbi:MAG TPA: DNA primase [Bacteroidia bacterium]|mgnify:CR=1 FL=1|nr:DNA primase [Bacteroidia bacterium]
MITPYSIDKILSVARIEEVISDFVALKKRGINFVGLCPFHNEKTPSFTVSPTKGIYKCFGCGASGNVVKFLMDHEKLSYPDALRWLAKKYNIIIEEVEETEETKKEKSERDKVLEVLQFAQKFFTNVLLTTDEGKEIGLNYLYNKRKIDFSLIQKFQLGFSPSNKRSFTDLALQAGFTPEILVKAGLVNCPDCEENKPIDVHKIYDKFFARVIFPICDISGKVIGFGGRTLSDDKSIAKYINSPQTIVYDKSKTLYGIHLAKKAIMQNDLCYLVEGYADVISLHKAGIENVVASSGTSLTTEQVKLIHRFTNNVVVLYDGDAAGIKAGIRAIDMLLEEGLNVKIVMFPDGDDPDSFVNKHSNREVFDFLKNNEKDFIQFKKELYHSENQSPIEKAKAIEEILTSVARIPNEIQRRVYIQTLSNDLKIEESTLLRNVQKIRQDIYLKKEKIQIEDSQEKVETEIQPVNNLQYVSTDTEEKELIKHLIKYGNVLINVDIETNGETQQWEVPICEYIVLYELKHDEAYFENKDLQLIIDEIENCLNKNFIPTEEYFIHHPQPFVSELAIKLSEEYKLSPQWELKYKIYTPHILEEINEVIRYLVLSFKEKKIRKLILAKQEELKKAQDSNDEETSNAILIEIQKLEEFKKEINKRLGKRIILC